MMRKSASKLKLVLATSLSAVVIGATIFYFVDEPFTLSFKAGLILMFGGILSLGLGLGFAGIKAAAWWKKALGMISVAVFGLMALAVLVLTFNYRFLSFKPISPAAWREDLRFLAATMEQRHKKPFYKITRDEFAGAVKALDEKIPALSESEIMTGMIKLVAMMQDGHSLMIPFIPLHLLPLQMYQFSDGLYITAAAGAYADLVGCRVLQIGNADIEDVRRAMRPLVSAANESAVNEWIPMYYLVAEFLRDRGFIENAKQVDLLLARERDQAPFTASLAPVDWYSYLYWYLRPLAKWKYQSPHSEEDLPVPLENRENKYWFELLAPSQTLYLQFNSVRDKSEESIAQFSARLNDYANAHDFDRFVIDLRDNDGGDNSLLEPLLCVISRNPKINRRGKLFTLIGRKTFFKTPFELLQSDRYEAAAETYRKFHSQHPEHESVSESRLNELGYRFLGDKRFKEAITILKLNTEFYPASSNTFDSLGEAYAACGDIGPAIAGYQKAVELNANNGNARMRLKKLKEQIPYEPSK